MGLFSSIKSVATKAVTAVKTVATKAVTAVKAVVASPAPTPVATPAKTSVVSRVASAVKAVVETRLFPTVGITGVSTAERLITEPAKEITRAVAESAAGLAIIYPAQTLTGAGKLYIGAITKAPVTTIAATLAAPAVVVAVAKSPTIQDKILGAPETYVKAVTDVGTDISKIAEGKYKLADAIEFLKTHPYLTAATAGAALLAAGYTTAIVFSAISNYYQKEAAQKFLEMEPAIPNAPVVADIKKEFVPEKAIPTNEGIPATPATTTITTGKRRYKKAKAKQITPSMRQSLQVLINNQNQRINKNYIKREQLYN